MAHQMDYYYDYYYYYAHGLVTDTPMLTLRLWTMYQIKSTRIVCACLQADGQID